LIVGPHRPGIRILKQPFGRDFCVARIGLTEPQLSDVIREQGTLFVEKKPAAAKARLPAPNGRRSAFHRFASVVCVDSAPAVRSRTSAPARTAKAESSPMIVISLSR